MQNKHAKDCRSEAPAGAFFFVDRHNNYFYLCTTNPGVNDED
jgi:hypothetical protein